jgi:dihydrofolate reductase
MTIAIIAAVADDGTIGHAGQIPWHISDDLKRFKRLTLGHPVIMGRKTFASIGKPLPGRCNLILTRHPTGPDQFASLEAALQSCRDEMVFVIGGAEVYRAALPVAGKLYLTEVRQQPAGDTKFPEYDRAQWREVAREDHDGFSFVDYERVFRDKGNAST